MSGADALKFTAKKKIVFTKAYLKVLETAPWSKPHTFLTATLIVAVAVDTMKPATIGFIMPGLLFEYGKL